MLSRKIIKTSILYLFSWLFIQSFCLANEQKETLQLQKIGIYQCGRQPKQVVFSPDGSYVVLPLLDDNGFDIFSIEEKKVIRRVSPPDAAKAGFAEGLFIQERNAFFVSQMTTGRIYEYSYPDFAYRRTIETNGIWSKFIAYSKDRDLLAVSNWVSNDISIISYSDGKVIQKIQTGKAPRGLLFTDAGNTLISLSFDSGIIEKFNLQSGKRSDCITIEKACMRHIVMTKNGKTAFISDMYNRKIYKLDLQTFKLTGQTSVYKNPNTICLLNDHYLFVSTRGPNNPTDYTKRSPSNGKIHIIDIQDMSIVKTFEGGKQPTGLDISKDGKLLCFSNFQDGTIELYSINYL